VEENINSTVLGYFGTITSEIFYDFQIVLGEKLQENK
jgi:hypothetical protein